MNPSLLRPRLTPEQTILAPSNLALRAWRGARQGFLKVRSMQRECQFLSLPSHHHRETIPPWTKRTAMFKLNCPSFSLVEMDNLTLCYLQVKFVSMKGEIIIVGNAGKRRLSASGEESGSESRGKKLASNLSRQRCEKRDELKNDWVELWEHLKRLTSYSPPNIAKQAFTCY